MQCGTASLRSHLDSVREALLRHILLSSLVHCRQVQGGAGQVGMRTGHCATQHTRRAAYITQGLVAAEVKLGRQLLKASWAKRDKKITCSGQGTVRSLGLGLGFRVHWKP